MTQARNTHPRSVLRVTSHEASHEGCVAAATAPAPRRRRGLFRDSRLPFWGRLEYVCRLSTSRCSQPARLRNEGMTSRTLLRANVRSFAVGAGGAGGGFYFGRDIRPRGDQGPVADVSRPSRW